MSGSCPPGPQRSKLRALTATGSGWRMQFLGGVAAGKEGTVALGALGQDWTQRDLSGGTNPPRQPYSSPLGLPALPGLPPPAVLWAVLLRE